MNKCIYFIGCMVLAAACAQSRNVLLPFRGPLPADVELDMVGDFALSGEGLQLALDWPCIVKFDTTRDTCTREQLDWIRVVARTPWNQEIFGRWSDAAHIVFPVDWTTTGLDPLDDHDRAVAGSAWKISGRSWWPNALQVAEIVKFISDADEAAPIQWVLSSKLDGTASVVGGTLRAGFSNTLVVQIANHGSGTAYRVVATARSSIEALHGQRLSFGMLAPGAVRIRKLEVAVPASEIAPDALVAFEISEGNSATSVDVSNRIPLKAAEPILNMVCKIDGSVETQFELDAGQRLLLCCTVRNVGRGEAKQLELKVTPEPLEVSVAGGGPDRSGPLVIPAFGDLTFNVTIIVPRTLRIDAEFEIAITVRDRPSSRTGQTTIHGVIRKRKQCEPGQLTRAQYRAKIEKFRDEVTAGDITQADYNSYDAQLVHCLK